eukprot:7962520-Heterocapsa_arctica.AAC.1
MVGARLLSIPMRVQSWTATSSRVVSSWVGTDHMAPSRWVTQRDARREASTVGVSARQGDELGEAPPRMEPTGEKLTS